MNGEEMCRTNEVFEIRREAMRLAVSLVSATTGRGEEIRASEIGRTVGELADEFERLLGKSGGAQPIPAVRIEDSVTDEYIVCLEDGKRLKLLKRYLKTKFGMTPEEYRAKWGLDNDYPMTAPRYSRTRSGMAKRIGLGLRKRVHAK